MARPSQNIKILQDKAGRDHVFIGDVELSAIAAVQCATVDIHSRGPATVTITLEAVDGVTVGELPDRRLAPHLGQCQ